MIFIMSITIAIVFQGCIVELDPEEDQFMTFTAIFETPSGYESRIVLADYHNLDHYWFITGPELQAYNSYISRTKTMVIIRKTGGTVHNDDLVLYDIERDTLIPLYTNTFPIQTLYGTEVYWDYHDKGFYYRVDSSWGDSYYYYDLATGQITRLDYNIRGVISENELLVFQASGYYNQTGVKDCFYIFNTETNELTQLINPDLEYINIDGIMVKSALYVSWNETKQRFLYAYLDSTQSAYRISTTNEAGTFKKEYTHSHYDEYPVWGPDNMVFFNRVDRRDDNYYNEGTYLLNTVSRKSGKLINLIHIDSAVVFMNASY